MTQLVAVSVPLLPPHSRTHIATRRKSDVGNSNWGRPDKIGVAPMLAHNNQLSCFCVSVSVFYVRNAALDLRLGGICKFALKSYGKNWNTESQFKISTKLTSESNCTQQVETLEKRQAIGQFLRGGWSLFLFDLSPAEHIDFCAQGQMCISHMGGEGGRAANRVRWQKDVVEWSKGPVNCKSGPDLIGI